MFKFFTSLWKRYREIRAIKLATAEFQKTYNKSDEEMAEFFSKMERAVEEEEKKKRTE